MVCLPPLFLLHHIPSRCVDQSRFACSDVARRHVYHSCFMHSTLQCHHTLHSHGNGAPVRPEVSSAGCIPSSLLRHIVVSLHIDTVHCPCFIPRQCTLAGTEVSSAGCIPSSFRVNSLLRHIVVSLHGDTVHCPCFIPRQCTLAGTWVSSAGCTPSFFRVNSLLRHIVVKSHGGNTSYFPGVSD